MDLLEYQAKALFQEVDIPTLPAQRLDRPTDIKFLKIPYPVVLKSQVSVGNRGKVGGVRFVENTIDGIAAAQTMFGLPIFGEIPQVLLAEAKYDVSQEFYLAVLIDYQLRCPVLMGAGQGGVEWAAVTANLQQVVIEDDFSPFYARKLAIQMGLSGDLLLKVANIVESMYRLMVANDLDMVEISPLGVSSDGEVMALDGKVRVNDRAIIRHPRLRALIQQSPAKTLRPLAAGQGRIGVLAGGRGLAIATVAEIHQAGGQIYQCWAMDRLAEKDIEWVVKNLIGKVDVILANFWGGRGNNPQPTLAALKSWPESLVLRLPPGTTHDLQELEPILADNLAAAIDATLEAIE
jgi:succinyl-CoA synthetase beta subunit